MAAVMMMASAIVAQESASDSPLERDVAEAARSQRLDWWHAAATNSFTESNEWVSFDLNTVLLDTLENSPRIQSVSRRTSIALEQIVQQDAMFDPNVLFESRVGRNNEPIGNTLTTGGPLRLIEGSVAAKAGITKSGRHGTVLDLSQEIGTFNSNSVFVVPPDQGNSRLAVSLTQPLLGRHGRVYNERLVTQARIDSRISWQEMRSDVEVRIAEVISAYWRLYELRCHLLQQTELLQRGEHIQQVVLARRDFDTGRVELAKTRQRVARRIDRQLQIEAEIARQQARLASLIGSEMLQGESGGIEFVPKQSPQFLPLDISLRDAVLKGIENRPEVRAAANDLEAAGLAVHVTRAELDPEVSGIFSGYLAGLDGNYDVLDAFTDQFTTGGPGVSAALTYEMPYGRRAARARYREAQFRYQQRNQQLREAMQVTTADIETALINVNTALAQQSTKRQLLTTSIEEENILTRRWEMMGDEGGLLGVVLENLLDAQQRRTEAEREWSSAQVRYLTSIVALQKAMGTLLIHEGIRPMRHCGSQIHFVLDGIVQDHVEQISPSDITQEVESEVDADVEAGVIPDPQRDVEQHREGKEAPNSVPVEGAESRDRVQRLPVVAQPSPVIHLPNVVAPQRLPRIGLPAVRRLPEPPLESPVASSESSVSERAAEKPVRLPVTTRPGHERRLARPAVPKQLLRLPAASRRKPIFLPDDSVKIPEPPLSLETKSSGSPSRRLPVEGAPFLNISTDLTVGSQP